MHPENNSAAAINPNETKQRDVVTLIAIHLVTFGPSKCFKQKAEQKKGDPSGPPKNPKNEAKSQLVLGLDSSPVGHFALVHAQAEAAIRIGADPRLEENRSALLSVIRQGNKCASVTFLALRPLHHPRLLAADPILSASFRA
jgi:hypothetical protein